MMHVPFVYRYGSPGLLIVCRSLADIVYPYMPAGIVPCARSSLVSSHSLTQHADEQTAKDMRNQKIPHWSRNASPHSAFCTTGQQITSPTEKQHLKYTIRQTQDQASCHTCKYSGLFVLCLTYTTRRRRQPCCTWPPQCARRRTHSYIEASQDVRIYMPTPTDHSAASRGRGDWQHLRTHKCTSGYSCGSSSQLQRTCMRMALQVQQTKQRACCM